jgi:hypothetical protein
MLIRAAGAVAEVTEPFPIAVVPDTQSCSETNDPAFAAQWENAMAALQPLLDQD